MSAPIVLSVMIATIAMIVVLVAMNRAEIESRRRRATRRLRSIRDPRGARIEAEAVAEAESPLAAAVVALGVEGVDKAIGLAVVVPLRLTRRRL